MVIKKVIQQCLICKKTDKDIDLVKTITGDIYCSDCYNKNKDTIIDKSKKYKEIVDISDKHVGEVIVANNYDNTKYKEMVSGYTDNINNPKHYKKDDRELETIEIMFKMTDRKSFMEHCKLTCVKYLDRYDQKNGIEDLKKATVYISFMINVLEKGEPK